MLAWRQTRRRAVLLAASALGLHSLRYLIAPVGDPAALASRHGYLGWVGPIVAAALAFTLGQVLVGFAWGHSEGRGPSHERSLRAGALAAGAVLLASFAAQEALEGVLSGSGLGPLAVAFGGAGTFVVVALALGLGAIVVVLSRHAEPLAPPAGLLPRAWRRLLAPRALAIESGPWLAPAGPLARHLAGRGPPAAS